MKLGENSVMVVGVISGLAAVTQFVLTKMFIPTIRLDVLQIIAILILGLLAIPSTTWLSDILDGRSATDLFFAIWIIQVGLGMSLSQRVQTTDPEPG
jgi:NhaP-type Na+/H+ or K+/H+ antiporter